MLGKAPLEVFFSYAHEDEHMRDELEKFLKLLQRQNLISTWHDRRISAGSELAGEIDSHIRSADIILLLISADFLSSDYCYGVELKEALRRHVRDEAIVIPIILRPVDWHSAPFGHILALPRDGKPITTWSNRDEALADVSRALREIVSKYTKSSNPKINPATVSLFESRKPINQDRVLDAAMSSHVVVGQSTELLAKIRLPNSPGLKGDLANDDEAEADPEDVRSTDFDVVFPARTDGTLGDLRVEMTLTSPDFSPESQSKMIFVPPDRDSDTCYFLLTPARLGSLRVLIELRWEEALRGTRRLRTECVASADGVAGRAGTTVVQMQLRAKQKHHQSNEDDRLHSALTSLSASDRFLPAVHRYPRIADPVGENNNHWERKAAEHNSPKPSNPAPSLTLTSPMRSQKSKSKGLTTILLATITAISTIAVAFFQFRQPSKTASTTAQLPYGLVLKFQVWNSKTHEPIANAMIIPVIDEDGESFQGPTDSTGLYVITAHPSDRKARQVRGKVFVSANGFSALNRNFVLSSNDNLELFLEPSVVDVNPPVIMNKEKPKLLSSQPINTKMVPIQPAAEAQSELARTVRDNQSNVAPAKGEDILARRPPPGAIMRLLCTSPDENSASVFIAGVTSHGFKAQNRRDPTGKPIYTEMGPFPDENSANSMLLELNKSNIYGTVTRSKQ